MEIKDLKLIEKHRRSNRELDQLYADHLKLDRKVDRLEQVKIRTPEDNRQLGILKKKKLEGRDKMEKILRTLR